MRDLFIGPRCSNTQFQTEGGMKERKNGVSVHAGCWLHCIVISKAPPPTTLAPVAEKMVNSCMAAQQDCIKGQRGGEDKSSHAKRLQTYLMGFYERS